MGVYIWMNKYMNTYIHKRIYMCMCMDIYVCSLQLCDNAGSNLEEPQTLRRYDPNAHMHLNRNAKMQTGPNHKMPLFCFCHHQRNLVDKVQLV